MKSALPQAVVIDALTDAFGALPGIRVAALFGSYARGMAHARSDIDVLVFTSSEVGQQAARDACTRVSIRLERDVSVLSYVESEAVARIRDCDPLVCSIVRSALAFRGILPEVPRDLPPPAPVEGPLPRGFVPLGRGVSVHRVRALLRATDTALQDMDAAGLSRPGVVGCAGSAALECARAVLELTGRRQKTASDVSTIRLAARALALGPEDREVLRKLLSYYAALRDLPTYDAAACDVVRKAAQLVVDKTRAFVAPRCPAALVDRKTWPTP